MTERLKISSISLDTTIKLTLLLKNLHSNKQQLSQRKSLRKFQTNFQHHCASTIINLALIWQFKCDGILLQTLIDWKKSFGEPKFNSLPQRFAHSPFSRFQISFLSVITSWKLFTRFHSTVRFQTKTKSSAGGKVKKLSTHHQFNLLHSYVLRFNSVDSVWFWYECSPLPHPQPTLDSQSTSVKTIQTVSLLFFLIAQLFRN